MQLKTDHKEHVQVEIVNVFQLVRMNSRVTGTNAFPMCGCVTTWGTAMTALISIIAVSKYSSFAEIFFPRCATETMSAVRYVIYIWISNIEAPWITELLGSEKGSQDHHSRNLNRTRWTHCTSYPSREKTVFGWTPFSSRQTICFQWFLNQGSVAVSWAAMLAHFPP